MIIRHWSDLPGRSLPPTGKCQLWLAWLDEEDPDAWLGYLSEDERLRASRLRSPRSADRFIVGRGILRALLSRSLGREPEQLVFSYNPHGKPGLAGGSPAKLSFNVSHSAGLAVFAIANGLIVGVDIEEIHPVSDLDATASIFLSTEELADFKALSTGKKLERFFTLWTRKEAILKACGSGFSRPDLDILAADSTRDLKSGGKDSRFQNERITMLDPAKGFKGALACL